MGRDYRRLRIGVGHPGHKDAVANYVLANFSKSEKIWLEPLNDAIAETAELLVTDEVQFLTRIANILKPRAQKVPSGDEGGDEDTSGV